MLSHFDHKRKRECAEVLPCYHNFDVIKHILFEAVKNDDIQAMQELVSKKRYTIDYCRDEAGNTALHLAAEKGHLGITNILIKGEVSLDAKNYDGNTPLHFAVYFGQAHIVERLIQLGSDVFVQNKAGLFPIAYAQGKSIDVTDKIVFMLENHYDIRTSFLEKRCLADLRAKRFTTELSTNDDASFYKCRRKGEQG